MAEEFDIDRAKREQHDILVRVQEVRNMLTNDVINHYWERTPRSDADVRRTRDDMRDYLRRASESIDRILNRL